MKPPDQTNGYINPYDSIEKETYLVSLILGREPTSAKERNHVMAVYWSHLKQKHLKRVLHRELEIRLFNNYIKNMGKVSVECMARLNNINSSHLLANFRSFAKAYGREAEYQAAVSAGRSHRAKRNRKFISKGARHNSIPVLMVCCDSLKINYTFPSIKNLCKTLGQKSTTQTRRELYKNKPYRLGEYYYILERNQWLLEALREQRQKSTMSKK